MSMKRASEVRNEKNCGQGRVVLKSDQSDYGHIAAFSRNSYGELTLRVQWSNISNSFTDDVSVHLANVFLVE